MEPQGQDSLPNLPRFQQPGAGYPIPSQTDTNGGGQSLGSTTQQPLASAAPTADSSLPAMASDADLIEKEWVDAAKRIIEEHKTDPYAQSRAMMLLRADYMKKRYSKVIKIPES